MLYNKYSENWEIFVGEIKIIYQEKEYTILGGISSGTADKQFYIRLYVDNNFIFGTWLHRLINGKEISYNSVYDNVLTIPFLLQIIEEAKRLGEMMVFA